MTDATGRRVWAVLELLDRQIVDREGNLAGKVDDLELELDDDPEAVPRVTAILSGLGSLAAHIGGDTGRWLAAVERRLAEHPAHPSRIEFGLVSRIGSDIEVAADREDLDSNRAETWARDVIIDRIPGAGHVAE
jgi:sporulation protein YlmC with PRC-barrel domain